MRGRWGWVGGGGEKEDRKEKKRERGRNKEMNGRIGEERKGKRGKTEREAERE